MAEWYRTGKDGAAYAEEAAEKRRYEDKPWRFWLRPGTGGKVTFLDSEGFYIYEHSIYKGSGAPEFYTCRQGFSECPLCEAGESATWCGFFTVIDHTTYVTKGGKEIKNQKKFFVARGTRMIQKLDRKTQEDCGGDKTWAVFSLHRDGKKECATGEDISFHRRLKKEEILALKPEGVSDEDWLKPFDYKELLAPLSVEELRRIVGQAPPIGADDDGEPPSIDDLLDDDLPF